MPSGDDSLQMILNSTRAIWNFFLKEIVICRRGGLKDFRQPGLSSADTEDF
jgi:hypothetical protein